jgi:hypothetical protein
MYRTSRSARLIWSVIIGLSLVLSTPVYAGFGDCAPDQAGEAGLHAADHPCCKHQGEADSDREAKTCHCDWVASGEVGPPVSLGVTSFTVSPRTAWREQPVSLPDDLPERPPRRS